MRRPFFRWRGLLLPGCITFWALQISYRCHGEVLPSGSWTTMTILLGLHHAPCERRFEHGSCEVLWFPFVSLGWQHGLEFPGARRVSFFGLLMTKQVLGFVARAFFFPSSQAFHWVGTGFRIVFSTLSQVPFDLSPKQRPTNTRS